MDFEFHPSIPMPQFRILYPPFVVTKKCEGSSALTITLHFPAAICSKGIRFNFLLSSEQTLKRTVYDVDLIAATAVEWKEPPKYAMSELQEMGGAKCARVFMDQPSL